jgi:RND family efflux transporter MFP subunit
MASISLSSVRNRFAPLTRVLVRTWKRFRGLALWLQWIIGIIVVVALFALISFLSHLGATSEAETGLPTVTLAPIGELSGTQNSVAVVGSVRSESEAQLLAQSGGTVTAIHTALGRSVSAGAVLAELDNASQRAAVLQAEGAYDAAVAARSGLSPKDIGTSALNTYTSSYNSLDSVLKNDVDTFYGNPGPLGPQFLISPQPFEFDYFPRKRAALTAAMDTWRSHLASATSDNAPELLTEADAVTRQANALITDIATAATKYNTDANATQLAALATARTSVASIQSGITAAKQSNQSQNSAATAGANANVESALGSLRAAQANLEKTLVRAPIAGQVNFFPIRVGDYVTPLEHVATVAQNGALEIVAYISEETRSHLSVGSKVTIEDKYQGVITSIAPALDPTTKQIEVHIGVGGESNLVNGQSVRIALPETAPSAATSTGPLLLPLTTLKLTPSARVVFSVDANGTLVAHPVEIGEVRGDRIEITTQLPSDLRIVSDARGLSEGQKVNVAQ